MKNKKKNKQEIIETKKKELENKENKRVDIQCSFQKPEQIIINKE